MSLIDDPQITTPDGEPLSLETNIKDILMPEHAELWDSISNGIETITIRQLLAHTAGLEKEKLKLVLEVTIEKKLILMKKKLSNYVWNSSN